MNNLNKTDKKELIDDFKSFVSNSDNFKEEPKKKNVYSKVETNPKLYLYCDIETFRFNLEKAQSSDGTPRDTKNATWIVQVAYFESDNDMPNWVYFKDFAEFLNTITKNSCKELAHYDIILVFHNGYKYDNHFLQKELQDTLHLKLYNSINQKAIKNDYLTEINKDIYNKKPTYYKEREDNYITVSAVRSSTSHVLTFSYNGLYFETEDSYLKTNDSLERVGQKCFDKGFLEVEYIKDKSDIDFNDKKYNLKRDLNQFELEAHKAFLLDSLTYKEFKYVRNDVVVLAMCHKHFSELYYGFSWDVFAFASNVKKEYEKNGYYKALTNFQLTKKTPKGKMKYNKKSEHKTESSLTLDDKPLAGWKSAEKFFRQFYRGGLNMYNEKYVGQIIEPERAGFSMDLNSSYPTVMYKEKLPTYLVEADHFGRIKRIPKNEDYFYMFQVTPKTMDNLLKYVSSRVIKQMFVKYYPVRNDGFIYINSVALNLLEEFMGKRIQNFSYNCYYKWKCEYFGARNVIKDNYFIKQHGKSKYEFKNVLKGEEFDPLNIVVDKTVENNNQKTNEEVQASKVLLNGIYGVPAMRPTFPQFIYDVDGNRLSMPDGHKNQERNVVFSVGVTAFAFRNLITPLTFLTPEEIDRYFWYCDTDSLYLDGAVRDKIVKEHKELFDPNNLGCWDLEHTNIIKFYPLNHKKYALYDTDDKKHLTVHAGGVSTENVREWEEYCNNTYKDSRALDLLVDKYFKNGTKIKVKRSILTKYNTIDIYDCISTLQDGLHDGKKSKHYLNTYKEGAEHQKKVLNFINDNYDMLIAEYFKKLAEVENADSESIMAEVEIDGYSEVLSLYGIIATKNFVDGKSKPLITDKTSKKEQKSILKQLEEEDDALIHAYKSYRNYIDWQCERLEVLNKEKLFKNLKDYFGNEYLAKEIADGVYITVDFRVIRKDNLKEYKIDLENFTLRFNKQKYILFTEYVRLFFEFTLDNQVDTVEKFLDKLIRDNYPKEIAEKTQLYKGMYVSYKGRQFRDPENEPYKNKEYKGNRLIDLKEKYMEQIKENDKKTYKKLYDYIRNHSKEKEADKWFYKTLVFFVCYKYSYKL